jgi:hypothetical protein
VAQKIHTTLTLKDKSACAMEATDTTINLQEKLEETTIMPLPHLIVEHGA